MTRIWAITKLTWKAAFRYRLFWVLAALLLGSVIVLPLVLKDDRTARGFTQLVLTYNLSVITTLLGFATLWIACGTLARDIEECQMQMVASKPIARWQIWLGKWLGIVLLNAALLSVAGAGVFVLLQWRAQKLPSDQQAILRSEIFVSRGSLKEPLPDLEAEADKIFKERLKSTPVPLDDQPAVRQQLLEQLKAGFQVVPPGYSRPWLIDLGLRRHRLRHEPLYLRAKFHVSQTKASGLFQGSWYVGIPEKTPVWQRREKMAPGAFHEFAIPPNLFTEDGKLSVVFVNESSNAGNPTTLLFPMEDGFEILYREGGFLLNFIRGLLVILFWLALLAALGLAAASLLSFPVAAFFSFSLLVVVLSSSTLSTVVAEGTVLGTGHDHGGGTVVATGWIDRVLVPVFKGLLQVITVVRGFSPVDALSSGRSIGWGELGQAALQIVVLMGGLFALAGIYCFNRRELATAQGTT